MMGREQNVQALAEVLCPAADFSVAWDGLSDQEQAAWNKAVDLLDGPIAAMLKDATDDREFWVDQADQLRLALAVERTRVRP